VIDLVPRKYHTGTFDPTSLHLFSIHDRLRLIF